MALAEAAGYRVAPSFKRVLVRELESKAFVEFQKMLARSGKRAVSIYAAGTHEPLPLTDTDQRAVIMAILKSGFRDSHGGVRVAAADSGRGGERTVGETVVAEYREAARVILALDDNNTVELAAVLRESASGRRRELAPWFIDGGRRFSADSAELAATLAPKLGLPLSGE